jgi:hypothetical protein
MSIAKQIAAKREAKDRSFAEVEEWGEEDQPLRLYFATVSARDIEKIQRKHKNFLVEATMASMVEMIILKCETEDGERAFSLEDKPILMGEPLGVIAKLFGDILRTDTVEDHVKN